MIERVLILCAGRAERWGNYRGTPKHLVSVDGEILLDRTIRLVRKHTQGSIVIVAFEDAYRREGTELYPPPHGPTDFCETDKLLSSVERWGEKGQTLMLFGDVFFTEAAMAAICGHVGPHRFFGRREKSYYTGCNWGELFALSFPAAEKAMLQEKMLLVRERFLERPERGGGAWALYELLHGQRGKHFTVIDDFTDDFDYPVDFETWLQRYHSVVRRLWAPWHGPLARSRAWRLICRWTRRGVDDSSGDAAKAPV